MNIRPTGHHVLIELEKIEAEFKETKLIMPDKTKDREQAGAQVARVLEIGPEAWEDRPTPWARVGDQVITVRYPGAQYDHDGEDSRKRIINDDEIIGIIQT